ncbi:MAG: sugar ABC transporter substrate-binding protein [Clostridia bacterium]|nr:sugar ABC transporter substrate-binding protein [Clostridia bacterium]
MKKILSLALALILCAALFVPAMAEEFNIVVNLKTLSSEYWQTVKSGIDKAAEELGLTIVVQGPAAESEIAEQVSQIETQLSQGPDAIIIAPDDNDAVVGAIGDYEGIVVFCDTTNTYEKQTSFVGTSNEEAAYSGGVYGIAINGEATKALIIYGQEGDNTSNLRKAGYERALEEAGLEPVAALSGNNTTDGATKVMEDQLVANPDINLVLCHNDDTALGALNAIEAAGVEGISIIGFDGNVSAIESIRDGGITATIAQQPAEMGYQSVMTTVAALNGEAVDAVVSVPTAIIDAANYADYLN